MFIAEIGINHHGDLSKGRELLIAAKEAGCDAVKFQYRSLAGFYSELSQIGDEIVNAELQKAALVDSELEELLISARQHGLRVGVSFFRLSDFNSFENHHLVDFYKIPSAEHDNVELIDACLETNRPVYLSTGGAILSELPLKLGESRVERLNVMHCVSNYPVNLHGSRLECLTILRNQPWLSVGYSSHDEDYKVCLVALGMGIDSLERHIVLDKSEIGLDVSSSSAPSEMAVLGKYFAWFSKMARRRFDKSLNVNQGEVINLQNLGTGLYAKRDYEIGQLLTRDDFNVFAPRLGCSVGEFIRSDDKILRQRLAKGEPLVASHFKPTENVSIDYDYLNSLSIALPVRMHDINAILNEFHLNCFEFHLSFTELEELNISDFASALDPSKQYSIHLPDYISSSSLLDLFSQKEEIAVTSERVISKVSDLSLVIEDKTGKKSPVVGSFPFLGSLGDPSVAIERLNERFSSLNAFNVLPQWLPPQGWYFGGSVKIDSFNNREFLKAISEQQLPICTDISHLILSANACGEDWATWYESLKDVTRHVHLSDASGVDGEGLQLGSGDLDIQKVTFSQDRMTVLEIWQGHLNDFAGFREALRVLSHEEDH